MSTSFTCLYALFGSGSPAAQIAQRIGRAQILTPSTPSSDPPSKAINSMSRTNNANPIAIKAVDSPLRSKPSNYPSPFAVQMTGREKRPLGDRFGLTKFGVNLTTLAPGSVSALRHSHTLQDEFIFVLEGNPTLHTDEGRTQLSAGMCAGFKAGSGNGHRLLNETSQIVVYLELGDRSVGDEAIYPDDDLKAIFTSGQWVFVHKDGQPYP